jgi:cytoskeletal protein CcmA (bactofilin family)
MILKAANPAKAVLAGSGTSMPAVDFCDRVHRMKCELVPHYVLARQASAPFGAPASREEPMSNPYDTAKARNSSVLGPTLKFKGELSADEDLLIQGTVEGSIRHTSRLTIGDSGRIKADIAAEYVAVEGNVEGDIHGSQSVTVRESADISGNICSPTVSLLEGATFNGKIDMSGEPQAATGEDAPVGKAAEATSAKKAARKTESDRPGDTAEAPKATKKSADAA